MKVVLHLGTYKTGTSSIQRYLRANQVSLQEQKIFYPLPHESGLYNQHSHIVSWLSTGNLELLDEYISCEIKNARLANCDVFLLSTEGFSSLNQKQILQLKNIIQKNQVQDIECIVYFRNVYDYIISNLCQLLKQPDDNFFSGKIVNQLKRRLNYDDIIRSWEECLFEVNVFSFDKNKKNLIPHFINNLSQNKSLLLPPPEKENVNISLTLTQTLMLVMSGEIKRHSDHERIIKSYNKKDIKHRPNEQEIKLAKLIFSFLNIEYKHQKLVNLKDELFSLNVYSETTSITPIEDILACLKTP